MIYFVLNSLQGYQQGPVPNLDKILKSQDSVQTELSMWHWHILRFFSDLFFWNVHKVDKDAYTEDVSVMLVALDSSSCIHPQGCLILPFPLICHIK